jgi:hypothetical protein
VDAPHAALLSELGLSASSAEMAFSDRAVEYRRLCERAARRAVILRSKGRCENPGCTGDIKDVTDRGEPLLEVDHIQDIAKGGPDNPVQMIALCPNCHTIKTHGRSREQLRRKCSPPLPDGQVRSRRRQRRCRAGCALSRRAGLRR